MRITEEELRSIMTDRGKAVKFSEKEITHSIRSLLKQFQIFHWKNFGGPMGEKGVSDLLGCYQGKMLALEVKKPGGRPSPEQLRFIENVKANGGIAAIVHSIDEVIELLQLKKRMLF